MLRILGKTTSINVRKVLWTCIELDIAYAQEEWGAGLPSTADPQFLALNPNAMLPVIQDDDFTLWKSSSIIRYVAPAYGGEALYPSPAKARARTDQWMDWQATNHQAPSERTRCVARTARHSTRRRSAAVAWSAAD